MTANDIYTVAGNGTWGNTGNGGLATSAETGNLNDVTLDASGNLFLSDIGNYEIRVVAASSGSLVGQSVTANDIYGVAGVGQANEQAFTGTATNAELNYPGGVRVDSSGDVFIADTNNNAIRFIPKTTGTYYGQSMTANDIYTVAGYGWSGYTGNGSYATGARLNGPEGIALSPSGAFAIADANNNVVRFVPKTSGTYFGQSMTANDIYTIAGNATAGYSGNGGPATSAEINAPNEIAFDAAGDLLIADSNNNVVRFVPVSSGTYYGQSMTANDIYSIAGNGTSGFSGNGGPATSAEFDNASSVVVDSSGDLLIADTNNNVVRFVPVSSGTYFGQSMTANDVYTIAGNATSGYSGNGGPATSAKLCAVYETVFDAAGNVLIVDSGNDVVRFVPRTSGEFYGQAMSANDIYTVAGAGWSNVHFSGDGGSPMSAEFGLPVSVAPDGAGGFYVNDYVDQRIRYVADTTPSSVSTTTYTYDADGEQIGVTTPNGNVSGANAANFTTTFTYNADGELTARTQAGGSGATVTARTTSYGYDGDGNVTSVTTPRSYVFNYTFNPDDEQTVSTNPLSNATLTCYDGDRNVAQIVPAVGVAANSLTKASCPTTPSTYANRLATDATTYAYNALGAKTTVTSPAPAGLSASETTTNAYDTGGRLTTVTAPPTSNGGGAPNDVTSYTYDTANELLTTTTGYLTTLATASRCYDPNGNLTATIPGDGNISGVAACSGTSPYETSSAYQTGYSYDSLGELVTQTAPTTTAAPSGQVTSYTYDPAGNVLTLTNPDGVVAAKTFTPLSQLASVSYSNATPDATYTYDANGNLTKMIDASGTTTDAYDPFNKLTSSTNGAGQTVSYAYDVDGNVTGITYPLGSGATWASTDTVTYTYDHADQLATVVDFNGHTSNVTTTADGLPSALSLGASGDTITTAYAANDAPSSITLGNGSTLQSFTYSDAPSGGVVGETDTPSSSLSPASYTYDAQSRVTADTAGTSGTKTYAQDRSSNLTTLPTGASGTYDNASELTASVLSGTTTSYTYDAAGNRTQASVGGTTTVSATYNGAGRVTSYDNAAANMSSASYNGLGLRASATTTPSGGGASTQNFVWNTADSTPNLLMDSTNAYIYGPHGTPFEQVSLSSGTIHYLVADLLGSVRGVVSSSGSLSATTSYDAWGNPQTSGGLMSYTPFGLGGGYSDATGLIYLLARYYDPSSGQFLSVDPMVDTTGQPYAFVNDNPLNSTDPLGLLGAGYPRTDWKQELKVWNSGGLNELIGIGLGAIASVAAVVAFVATSPEIVLAATVVAAVAGLGAEATDGVRCLSGARSACPGAILGLPGLVVAIAAFAPVESAIALAAPAASAMFAVAIIVTDSVIKFVQTMTKSSKRAKLPS